MSSGNIFAEEIFLNNGDRISGKIIVETGAAIIVETQVMGRVSVDKDFINTPENYKMSESAENRLKVITERFSRQKEKKPAEDAPKEDVPQWQRKLSIGYSQTGGNTEVSQGSGELSVHRKTGHDEWTGKLTGHISTSNDEMDAKKFYGMGVMPLALQVT